MVKVGVFSLTYSFAMAQQLPVDRKSLWISEHILLMKSIHHFHKEVKFNG